jgi:D-tyrosyl-tRNA(Tyr) deacylase
MKAVVQRVVGARVTELGEGGPPSLLGEIGPGLLVLVGVGPGDSPKDVAWMADKLVHLRIFPAPSASGEGEARMRASVVEVGGSILVVSQFTLYGDCSRGRRPSFAGALAPELARPLVDALVEALRHRGVQTATGRFGAHMQVELVNDGPVTLILESERPKMAGGV